MTLSRFLLAEQGRLTKEDVDMRMCKTLADMPSDLALEAVDKFAMASLDTVRSKTGFMVRQPPHALPPACMNQPQSEPVMICWKQAWQLIFAQTDMTLWEKP